MNRSAIIFTLLASIATSATAARIADNQAFDAYPNAPFEQVSINDGMATLMAVKGHDGLLHHVVSLQDDGHCNGHTATTLGTTTIKFNHVRVDVTQACSTAGTLYLSPVDALNEDTAAAIIHNSQYVTVAGAPVGNAVFNVEAYGQTLNNFGLAD